MASQLREVLFHFEHQTAPTSLNQMAKEMQVTPGVLEGMIDYWVRKGKLRAINSGGEDCNTCGNQGACPFVVTMPRYYERVTEDDAHHSDGGSCCTCGGGCSC